MPLCFYKRRVIMPNWCYTSYVVTGEEKEVRDLYEKMRSLEEREQSLVENGFGKTWLGNLVVLLSEDWKNIRCRGWWENLSKDCDDGALRLDVMSAWCEMAAFRRFICGKYPSLEVYFVSEEPGMGIYETNDADGEYFPARYYFARPDDCEPYKYEEEELEEFLRDVGDLLGKWLSSAQEAVDAVRAFNSQRNKIEEFAEIKVYKVVTDR